MSSPLTESRAKLINWWKRLHSDERRSARRADSLVALGIRRMRNEPAPEAGLARTLASLDVAMSEAERRKGRRRAFRQRLTAPAAVCAVLFVVSGTSWVYYANINPDIRIPSPTMPVPNAFDFYKLAGQGVVKDKEIAAALEKHTVPILMGGTTVQIHLDDSRDPETHTYTLDEKKKLIAENAVALRTLRQGFAYPYQEPPCRSAGMLMPHFATYRSMARLLALDAQVKEEHEDWSGAADSSLDAIELGVTSTHGGLLIGKLVGIACEAIGRSEMWNILPNLTAAEAEAAEKRLERIETRYTPFADTMQEEKWSTQSYLKEMFADSDWVKALRQTSGSDEEGAVQQPNDWQYLALRIYILRYPKRQIFGNHAKYMDALIANAKLPYAAPRTDPPIPQDPLNQILCPVFAQGQFLDVYSRTQDSLLMTALALQAYSEDEGSYPENLAALAPKYMSHVPDDPFAISAPLRYALSEFDYTLYSVGPDKKDDGGRPVVGPETDQYNNRRSVHRVQPDSQGDIVAGINVN